MHVTQPLVTEAPRSSCCSVSWFQKQLASLSSPPCWAFSSYISLRCSQFKFLRETLIGSARHNLAHPGELLLWVR